MPASGTAPANELRVVDTSGLDLTIATGDINGDGCSDLVVGDPAAAVGTSYWVGAVSVYYGSPTGLATTATIIRADSVPGGTRVANDQFGSSVTTGDFNHDGFADIAIGAVGHNGYRGEVFVFPGNRLFAVGTFGGKVFSEGDGTIPGHAEAYDDFGLSITTGDFNGDGRSDLVVGDPGENGAAGAVMVLRGSGDANLLTPTGAQTWTQDSTGILGVAESGDRFGDSVAVGDFAGNGRTDLAIGADYETVDGITGAGAVNIIYSAGTSGLTSTGNQLWDPESPGLDETPETSAAFGNAFAAGDFNGDGRTDLAIGICQADVGAVVAGGAVVVLNGATTTGLVATGQVFDQSTPGVPGNPQAYDDFGWSLAASRMTSATRDDLFVGVPFEVTPQDPPNSYVGAGEFLHSTASGLTGSGALLFSSTTPGLAGPESNVIGRFAINVG